jgi:hypothetical protein
LLRCNISAADPATLADLVAAASGLTRCAQQQATIDAQRHQASLQLQQFIQQDILQEASTPPVLFCSVLALCKRFL